MINTITDVPVYCKGFSLNAPIIGLEQVNKNNGANIMLHAYIDLMPNIKHKIAMILISTKEKTACVIGFKVLKLNLNMELNNV